MAATKLAELETALGWNMSSDPLVMDTRICRGVISTVMFDWMHIYCVNGNVQNRHLIVQVNPEINCKDNEARTDPVLECAHIHAKVAVASRPRQRPQTFATPRARGHGKITIRLEGLRPNS